MSRDRKMFTLGGIVKSHSLDDVQSKLLLDVEDAMNALWPDTAGRPPTALNELHLAICLLCDWTSRTDRGRARLRKRYLNIIDIMEQQLQGCDPNLLRSVIAADDKEQAAVDGNVIADAVEAWLLAGPVGDD